MSKRGSGRLTVEVIVQIIAFNVLLALTIFAFITMTHPSQHAPRRQYLYQGQGEATPVPDPGSVRFDSYPHPNSRGALAYSIADRWDRTDLTYHVYNCPTNIDCDDALRAIRAAFQSWAELSPLTFTEVNDGREADIEMGWSNQGPELGYIGDVLAYATFPSDGGDVYFDDAEPWRIFDGSEFDLYLVATHELGHALGLAHSSVPSALMYPVLTGETTGLTDDDVAAIQALYGLPNRDDVPTQNIPPSTEAETVSGEISDRQPYEIWEFEAFAGETLTVTMTVTSGDLDPYVGILTNDEETVLAEGRSNGSGTAQVSYTFDQDGTYVIVATRDGVQDGFTAGSYDLTIGTADANTAAPPAAGQSTGSILVDVRSYTPADLCEVYISPSSSDDWGDDLLAFTLTNGNGIELYFEPDVYDVQVVTCDGQIIETYEVSIDGDLAIEVYEDEINVYAYG